VNPPDTEQIEPGRTPAEVLNTALGQILSRLVDVTHEAEGIPPASAARSILDQMREKEIGVSLGCLEWLSPEEVRILISKAVGTYLTTPPVDADMSRPLSSEPCERHFDIFELHPEPESP